jgi:hypothetical protein
LSITRLAVFTPAVMAQPGGLPTVDEIKVGPVHCDSFPGVPLVPHRMHGTPPCHAATR